MALFDLKGKRAFIAGVGDDQGYGWFIAKALAEAGCEVLIGTWTPMMKIFTQGLKAGKFDASRKLSDGKMMDIAKIYPLDAAFDTLDDVPEEIKENKRYKDVEAYTIADVAAAVKKDFGTIDFLVHSIANGPEVQKALLDTSRHGYLSALSASSYSFVSLVQHFGPLMNQGGSALTLSFIASERAIPGYGGGMSSAKSALEGDVRTLAWEAGRRWDIRVNAISAGPLRSRAARAIGFIDKMINYSKANAPLAKDLTSQEIGNASLFLLSPMASAVTGVTLYVDNGLHAMGFAVDSPCMQ
ncbi:MAG: enoyl-[acyl-carrier-protein] reductase [Chlamydiales bacterium]|nr:enoyl-[acyl-carrier-protein] reductase [Chlamydiia bacterium]MCP5508211.1 enoyl-[acyl-carrier-protein] reductase [Chlamydiales bacterium]